MEKNLVVVQVDDEYRTLCFQNCVADQTGYGIVEFWFKVYDSKDSAGNLRFSNLCELVFALLSLPVSNASVERVFSVMNIVKNKLRNRLLVETVDSILCVRYGAFSSSNNLSNFKCTEKMFSLFTDSIYATKDDNMETVDLNHDDGEVLYDVLNSIASLE